MVGGDGGRRVGVEIGLEGGSAFAWHLEAYWNLRQTGVDAGWGGGGGQGTIVLSSKRNMRATSHVSTDTLFFGR